MHTTTQLTVCTHTHNSQKSVSMRTVKSESCLGAMSDKVPVFNHSENLTGNCVYRCQPEDTDPIDTCTINPEISSSSVEILSPANRKEPLTLPMIVLSGDKEGTRSNLVGPASLLEQSTPRTSYNSLLHWDLRSTKDEQEYLLNKYSELGGNLITVEIPISQMVTETKPPKPPQLGIRLAGHRDVNQMSVFVCGLRSGSVADNDGRIRVGDQLLEVNDHCLYGMSHLNAAPIIHSIYLDAIRGSNNSVRKTKLDSIRFVLQRDERNITCMAAMAIDKVEQTSTSFLMCKRHLTSETFLNHLLAHEVNTNELERVSNFQNNAYHEGKCYMVEQMHSIHLITGTSGFGFIIMERNQNNEQGIYVKHIIENGPAHKDGRLRAGDRLIKVNKRDVTGVTYNTVLHWIRSSKHTLSLDVSRWIFNCQTKATREQHVAKTGKHRVRRFSSPHLCDCLTNPFTNHIFNLTRSSRPKSDSCSSFNPEEMDVKALNKQGCQTDDWYLKLPSSMNAMQRSSSPNLSLLTELTIISSTSPTSCSTTKLKEVIDQLPVTFAMSDETLHLPTYNTEVQVSEPENTRQILVEEETYIELQVHGSNGLGLSFVGGAETVLNELVVHQIHVNGAAAKDARILPGDHITKVNNNTLVGMPFLKAVRQIHLGYCQSLSNPNQLVVKVCGTDADLLDEDGHNDSEVSSQIPFRLSVYRAAESFKWYDQEIYVELLKKPGKVLGLGIVDRYPLGTTSPDTSDETRTENPTLCFGVVVTEILKGSLAESDGRLQVGDQILNVNGEDTTSACSQLVGALLRASVNKVTIKAGRLRNQVVTATSAFQTFFNP